MLKSNFDIRWLTFLNVQDGFKILGPSPVVIPWKTDPRELIFNYPDLVSETNGLTIKYPVQIGKIVVKGDIPFKKQGWVLPLFISGNGIKTYQKIKAALENMMRGKSLTKDEHADGSTTKFYISRAKLAFRLEYPFPSDSQTHVLFTNTDACLLSIEFNSMVSHESKKDNRRIKKHTDNYRSEHGY